MVKTKKEEAMGYRGKDMRQILLLAWVGALSLSLAGAICGCGSNESQPVALQGKKPAATATTKPQAKEVPAKTHRGAFVPASQALLGRTDPGNIEVVPPAHPGERGMTTAELKAKAGTAAQMDPKRVEVVPPSRPGERGLTQAELMAKAGSTVPEDPDSMEVVPPSKPGERGLTQAELMAKAGGTVPVDPDSMEVVPPSKPGERGLTQAELKAKALDK
jgi:hypothetical protein